MTPDHGSSVGTHRYHVVVTGHLGELVCEAFGGVDIEFRDRVTVVSGDFDQAALFGAIHLIQQHGLELVEIIREPQHAPA